VPSWLRTPVASAGSSGPRGAEVTGVADHRWIPVARGSITVPGTAHIGCGDLTLCALARGEATAVSTPAPEPVELQGQHPPALGGRSAAFL
jgi:hypothetical protein